MDRRRFVPSPDGLEGRALLSLFGSTKATAATSLAQDVPVTFRQKQLRIDHLPFYLRQTEPGRLLPDADLQTLQADLTAIAGRLHRPPTHTLEAFNARL